jgi:hypothetical protein
LILFLTVKIIHEVSHLLHYASYLALQSHIDRTPKKAVTEDIITKLDKNGTIQAPVRDVIVYDDFGENIERRIFGGLIEAKWNDPKSFMDIDNCALYKSKGDMVGFYVDCLQTLSKITANSTDFSFMLREPFQARKTKSFAFAALSGGGHRPSHSADPDVDIEEEQDEDTEEEEDYSWRP